MSVKKGIHAEAIIAKILQVSINAHAAGVTTVQIHSHNPATTPFYLQQKFR